jgi:hypothetical protein
MPILRRELAFQPDCPGIDAGDWWHLAFDPETLGLYVEHTWRQLDAHSERVTASGSQRFGINDFLTLAEGRSAQPFLVRALGEMFRDAAR